MISSTASHYVRVIEAYNTVERLAVLGGALRSYTVQEDDPQP